MEHVLKLTDDKEIIDNLLSGIKDKDNAASIEWEPMYGWKVVITDNEGKTTDIYLPHWLNLAIDRKVSNVVNYQQKKKWWQLF